MKTSLKDQIESYIKKSRKPFFLRSDFADFGDYRQVTRALTSVERAGLVERSGHGIYKKKSSALVDVNKSLDLLKRRLGRRVSRTIKLGDNVVTIGRIKNNTAGVIPETNRFKYLSGMAALNIPSESGSGDWHLVETFLKPKKASSRLFVTGVGCSDDTTPLLADAGVYECSKVLDQYKIPRPAGKVFAANHARAIVDMVVTTVLGGGSPEFITLDDWMPSDEDKQSVFSLLSLALTKIEPSKRKLVSKWMMKNST